MTKPDHPTEALVLAGGLGTRLRSAVPDLPKPLAPVGGRPFLEHLLSHWRRRGIDRFVLSVGYKADLISDHFGTGYLGAAIDYVREEEPLGTGGALALAFRRIAFRGRRILLLNGDTWFPADLEGLLAAADPERPVNLVLVRVEANDRYGGVELDGRGGVVRFGLPAEGKPALINAGCYLLNCAKVAAGLAGFPERFSLEADWLAPLAESGKVGGIIQEADFIDIGVPDDYRRFCRDYGAQLSTT
ncbi:MAG: nucleotidyltransferase family protein [Planctomycetota bacterium]|nr:nucleotidyltransferase family protein [Planctomycetota bacterium]